MWLGLSGRFRARWSRDIHEEWKRNVLLNRPDLTREQLDRTSNLPVEGVAERGVWQCKRYSQILPAMGGGRRFSDAVVRRPGRVR